VIRTHDAGSLRSTDVGSEGLNLQFCRQLINFDLPWNPMRIEQRIGRLHRIGQENPVEVLNFCLAGSIEERILRILSTIPGPANPRKIIAAVNALQPLGKETPT